MSISEAAFWLFAFSAIAIVITFAFKSIEWFGKPKTVEFDILQPAGEAYFVIRRKKEGKYGYYYKYHFYNKGVDFLPHHDQGTRFNTAQEAIDVAKKFPEFDTVVASLGTSTSYSRNAW